MNGSWPTPNSTAPCSASTSSDARPSTTHARRIDTPAHEFPIDTGLFARLRDGQPITMHLPARPWRHVTMSEPYHFVFTSKTGSRPIYCILHVER
ncbi:hypothetical protein ACWDZ8_02890 [Streptomyces sp. NPDC003233]